MDQPIEYVGGQPEGPRRHVWPFAAGGAVLLVALLGLGIVVWQPVQTAGRAIGNALVPYSINLEGQWIEEEKVVGRPAELSLEVRNTDSRSLDGLTLRLKGLTPAWSLLSATPDGELDNESVFFPGRLGPTESKTLSVRMIPNQSGRARFQLSLAAGRSGTLMRMNGQANTLLVTTATREARATDIGIRPTVFYVSRITPERESSWDVRIENAGIIRITSVTLRFAELPRSFEVTSTSPNATVSGDGSVMRFATTLDPGEKTTVTVRFLPHRTGFYHVSTEFYLSDHTEPYALPNGSNQIGFDVIVG